MFTFAKANNKNRLERDRLMRLIHNLKMLNAHSHNNNWWQSLHVLTRQRLHNLKSRRESKPENYNIKNLKNQANTITNKWWSRRVMYGYMRKQKPTNIGRHGHWIPVNLPENEAVNFSRSNKPYSYTRATGGPSVTTVISTLPTSKYRNNFTKEGLLKPQTYGPRKAPSPAKKPLRGYLPTLKEIAWQSNSLAPLARMNNDQLKFLSSVTGINWAPLKPKPRAPPLSNKNLTKYRRNLAARTIQRAFKKSHTSRV